jgi:hypothetical protein
MNFISPQNLKMTNSYQAPSILQQVIDQMLGSGQVTRQDEAQLFGIIASDINLSPTELHRVRQVMNRLDMGLLKVVD